MVIGKSRAMSWYVYILKSEKNGRYYIGSTNNLDRRLSEHNRGKTRSLKSWLPLEMKFSQEFDDFKEARKIEGRLKSWKNKGIIEKIISDGIIKSI